MRNHGHLFRWAAACAVWIPAATAVAGINLLINGSFDHPDGPLTGWKYDYRDTGNRFYEDNHTRVSVRPSDMNRRNVLALFGTREILWGTGQGTKVDSHPVPFDPEATYRLTAWGRSLKTTDKDGPNARVYIEGYQWRPGVKPHPNPELSELRRIYKQGAGNILYFGRNDGGAFSNVTPRWQKGTCTFPMRDLSEQARRHLQRVQFITVHIVAIDRWDGYLLIDDVSLERIK